MIVGKRLHPALRAGRRAFVSMSAIALLALLCVPALASAEDSSGVQYSDSLPELPKKEATHHRNPAKASKTENGTGSSDSEGSNRNQASDESESSSMQGGGVAAGNDGGNGQGKPAGSANGEAAKSPSGSAESIRPASTSGDDGGSSSTLGPILIAIAVLAAISLGAVLIRRRRQGRGPTATASPEAN